MVISTKKTIQLFLLLLSSNILATQSVYSAEEAVDEPPVRQEYLVGRGMSDITGPAWGIPMWGFSYDGQVTEGIHLRLKSRAFILAESYNESYTENHTENHSEADNKRVVFVSADIGSIEHNITLEILDRLEALYGDVYNLDNVIISATHTHAGPGGYWHSRKNIGLAGAFYQEHFDAIVSGIVRSISLAHEDLRPGTIRINKGDVEGAGINRSLIAYKENPASERARYKDNIDKAMTLLKFSRGTNDIGMLNWYAVHPTSMTYNNRLISGDHKGYAAAQFEKRGGKDFVAAFAQANPGDVTANLNLNNTGPGDNDVESTRIIGGRQLDVAQDLFDKATETLSGKIDYRQIYVDLSRYAVSGDYTGAGEQTTCPSAYGYSFAGGSTEDGGGHFLFEEGMTESSFFLDLLIKLLTGTASPTEAVQTCQLPKPILWETGTGTPPMQSQIRSISLVRIGQLVIIAMPAEVTTMSGRRLREGVMSEFGDWAKYAVISGYANGFAGYVTTPEEYQIQQYEGGHTLHGQWSLPAYRQITSRLAKALEQDEAVDNVIVYDDWRGKSTSTVLGQGIPDELPAGASFGDARPLDKQVYKPGDSVEVTFWSSNPTENYTLGNNFLTIQKSGGITGEDWQDIADDHDWSTEIRWQAESTFRTATISWLVPEQSTPGQYRIGHQGLARQQDGSQSEFSGYSASFTID